MQILTGMLERAFQGSYYYSKTEWIQIVGIRRWIKENSRKIELYGQYFKIYHFYLNKVVLKINNILSQISIKGESKEV